MYCNFSDSLKAPKPQTFADWFWAPLIALAKAIIGIIFFIVMAIVLLVILIIKFFIDIFMEVLPILQYILWLIIRVILLIFIWFSFVFTLLFLTIVIGVIALIFLPVALMFNSTIKYTINSVKLSLPDFSFSTGYHINLEYYSFFDIWVPFLNIYCFLGNLTLFDLLIKFWLPSFNFNNEGSSQPESSGINPSSLVTKSSEMSLIEEEFYSIKSSSSNSSDFDSDLFIESIPEFFIGLDQAFGGWSMANTVASLSFVVPPDKEYVNWIIQILSIVVFIVTLILHILIANYNKYEWCWFLLGAGIASIVNGIFFYKAGKSNNHNWVITMYDDYLEAFKSANTWSEFISDVVLKDMCPLIFDGYTFFVYDGKGLEPPNLQKLVNILISVISLGFAIQDWFESFNVIRLVSNMAMYQCDNHDKRVKIFSGISIGIGAVLIILGTILLFTGSEEN